MADDGYVEVEGGKVVSKRAPTEAEIAAVVNVIGDTTAAGYSASTQPATADHIEQELVRLHFQLLEPPVESKRKRDRLSV